MTAGLAFFLKRGELIVSPFIPRNFRDSSQHIPSFGAEACRRGVRRIWVASYDFQAPDLYEKAGFERIAEFEGWPEGHVNVALCKRLAP